MEINKYIDHTILKRDAVQSEVDKIIGEAIQYNFKTVCIHPTWTEYVANALEGTGIGVTVVFGFPYGTQTTESKIFEAKDALAKGATELDMVVNVGRVHMNDTEFLERELTQVREALPGTVIKLILETGLLSREEIRMVSELGVKTGWDFIKTSTGIQTSGATTEDVLLMKSIAGDKAEVKASGGVRSYEDAVAMIEAGATRIGTSNGVDIMEGRVSESDY